PGLVIWEGSLTSPSCGQSWSLPTPCFPCPVILPSDRSMILHTLRAFHSHPNSDGGSSSQRSCPARSVCVRHRASCADSNRDCSKWHPPNTFRCKKCHMFSKKNGQSQQNTTRRKYPYVRREKTLLFAVVLLSTVTLSKAHEAIFGQRKRDQRSSQRRMPHKRGDPPDVSNDDIANYDTNTDYSAESLDSSGTDGASAYGDYGVYTPKGSSGIGSGGDSGGGKPKAKSGNSPSSSSSLSSGFSHDSYETSESSPSSSTSSRSYGSDSYFSEWGPSSESSRFKTNFNIPSLQISLLPAIVLILFVALVGMLLTAHQMENSPEGTFANCCRVSLATVSCICKVIYNLYHCRLGDIPQVVFASDFEDDDELTDDELQRMKLRPGIERALDVEHRKALRKVGIEMKKIKVVNSSKKKKECREGLPGAVDSSKV
ncbi:hypothetical protein ACHAW6_006910, partial [Cyclotella cf. meneghiniana]